MKYTNYKLTELKEMAKNLKLKDYSKLNKEDLISLIKKNNKSLPKLTTKKFQKGGLPNSNEDVSSVINSPKFKLTRAKSSTVSNQGSEGTCFAHAASRMLSRLIKLRFSDYFEIENEKCNYFYDTNNCFIIFNCFLEEYGRNDKKCKDNLDENGWNKENISALLFRLIYNLITKKFGTDGGNAHESIEYVLDVLRSGLQIRDLQQILRANYFYIINKNIVLYFNTLMSKLLDIIVDIKKSLDDGTFYPQIYSGALSKVLINKKTNYSSMALSEILSTNSLFEMLKFVLNKGFYAIFRIYDYSILGKYSGHALTITGFEENNAGSFFIVKNSWGENSNWKNIVKNNKISIQKLSNFALEISCTFIFPYEYSIEYYNNVIKLKINSNRKNRENLNILNSKYRENYRKKLMNIN